MIEIKKGLDLPIGGAPADLIEDARSLRNVAVLGVDFPGMKPTMEVREGDRVTRGGLLFTDKKTPGVRYTAPASGVVSSINRGAKRALLSVVIEIDGDEAEDFGAVPTAELASLSRQPIVDKLVASGLWPALRTRPFSRVPAVDSEPVAIFITAMESNPLSPDAAKIINEQSEAFARGLDLVAKLTQGTTYVCQAPNSGIPNGSAANLQVEVFGGVHPAGLAGTHIHFLDPVNVNKTVWTIGYQDVIAFGLLFTTGTFPNQRTFALAGPGIENPRLVRSQLGASIDELTAGETQAGEHRAISGSVLAGRTASGPLAFVGRYHNQVSVLAEDRERKLLGYLRPGLNSHSVFPIYLAKWFGRQDIKFTTTSNGSARGMVPIGTFDRVTSLDILPTQLLRALLVGDVDTAIKLGALELDEEDVAIYTYACPGKYEYGPVLRDMLTQIEKEG